MNEFQRRRTVLAFTLLASALAIVLAFFAAARPGFAGAPSAPPQAATDNFLCFPNGVGAFENRVHVRCTLGGPPGGIFYFAVCTAPNPAHAARMLSAFTTAKVTAKNVMVFYNASDTTSGAACGCTSGDCRIAWGAEVQQ